MTRNEFLQELYQRLRQLPQAERDAAMAYYEEYFADAGPDLEAAVEGELGTPAQAAAEIIADFALRSPAPETKGAQAQAPAQAGNPAPAPAASAANVAYGQGSSGSAAGPTGSPAAGASGSAAPGAPATPTATVIPNTPPPATKNPSGLTVLLIVLAGLFGLPIALPLGIALVALLFGIFITCVAFFASLFISALALVLVGVAGIIVGVVSLPADIAAGILLLGLSALNIAFGLALLCGTVVLVGLVIRGITWMFARILKREGGRSEGGRPEVSRSEGSRS